MPPGLSLISKTALHCCVLLSMGDMSNHHCMSSHLNGMYRTSDPPFYHRIIVLLLSSQSTRTLAKIRSELSSRLRVRRRPALKRGCLADSGQRQAFLHYPCGLSDARKARLRTLLGSSWQLISFGYDSMYSSYHASPISLTRGPRGDNSKILFG